VFLDIRVSHLRVLCVSGLIAAASLLAQPASQPLQTSSDSGQRIERPATPGNGAASGFTSIDVPDAGGSTLQGTVALFVNQSGDVAGIYIDTNNAEHAFTRTAAGVISAFDAPGAAGTGSIPA